MDSTPEKRALRSPASSAGNGGDGGQLPEPPRDGQSGLSSDPKLTFGAERFAFQDPATAPPATPAERTSPVWVHRVWLIIFVMFCIELGMLLAVLPWTRVWTDNSLLFAYPQLRSFMHQNFVRGAVTGLGLIDIWIGIWEAVHYRETK